MTSRKVCPLITKFLLLGLKFIAIVVAPFAMNGFAVSQRKISGDLYVAVLELLGNDSRSGAIEIFGADIQSVSTLLDFLRTWSLPVLIAICGLGFVAIIFSKDKLKAALHICLGLFISFGIWAILITRSRQTFTEFIGPAISELSALEISAYLSELNGKLLNFTGLLSLFFGVLALGFWALLNRRRARTHNALN